MSLTAGRFRRKREAGILLPIPGSTTLNADPMPEGRKDESYHVSGTTRGCSIEGGCMGRDVNQTVFSSNPSHTAQSTCTEIRCIRPGPTWRPASLMDQIVRPCRHDQHRGNYLHHGATRPSTRDSSNLNPVSFFHNEKSNLLPIMTD